jgi:hypothetical protein
MLQNSHHTLKSAFVFSVFAGFIGLRGSPAYREPFLETHDVFRAVIRSLAALVLEAGQDQFCSAGRRLYSGTIATVESKRDWRFAGVANNPKVPSCFSFLPTRDVHARSTPSDGLGDGVGSRTALEPCLVPALRPAAMEDTRTVTVTTIPTTPNQLMSFITAHAFELRTAKPSTERAAIVMPWPARAFPQLEPQIPGY